MVEAIYLGQMVRYHVALENGAAGAPMVAAVPFVGRAFAAGERVCGVGGRRPTSGRSREGFKQEGHHMKRRTFVGAAAAGMPAFAILGAGGARAQSKEIRMIESGGKSGESIEVGYIEPLTKKTGIKVLRESPSSLGKLRALVESGQTSTVLFELGSGVMVQARKLGLIEKIDWAAVAPAAMFPEAKNDYGFGYQYFSTIMAWRAGQKAPKTWAEFFDTKAFPGKRCLPDYPHYCLPFAVMATGVPADKLFPLDVEAGFKKLNEIKKDISVWWKAGAQPPQLLKDNEVQYAICWSGRVVGDPAFGMNFAGGMADLS